MCCWGTVSRPCHSRGHTLDRSRVGVILGNIVLPTEKVSTLAREILGWEPRTPIDEGLRRTLEYFKAAVPT